MGDFTPQKIGEQYHFLSPSNQMDFDKIRTLLGRYWDIGSAFGFIAFKPTPPLQMKAMVSTMMQAPVYQNLALKNINLAIVPGFATRAAEKYDWMAEHVNIVAAAKEEPLGPAFPLREQKFRTRFLETPKLPKEYFMFLPEANPKDNNKPLIYSSDMAAVLESKISVLQRRIKTEEERLSPPKVEAAVRGSEPEEPTSRFTYSGNRASPPAITRIETDGTTRATDGLQRGGGGIQRGATTSPRGSRKISNPFQKLLTPSSLSPANFSLSQQTLTQVATIANAPDRATPPVTPDSPLLQQYNSQLSAKQAALKWARVAATNPDGSQYEVHNIFLNSKEIGSKEVTELKEAQMIDADGFENPWKPTQAFQVPMSKMVTKLTNELLEAVVNSPFTWDDFVFNFPRPLSRNIVEKMNAGSSRIRYGVADEKAEYSYYLENYERTLETPTISERIVPNVYSINMVQYFTEKAPLNSAEWSRIYNPEVYHIVSCGNKIPQERIQFKVARNDADLITAHRKIGRVRKRRGNVNSNSAYMDYLEDWQTNQDAANEADFEIANDKGRNIVFSPKDYNFLQEISSKSENLPMCTRLELAVENNHRKDESIVELFRKSNCLSLLMVKAMEHYRMGDGSELSADAAAVWSHQQFNYFPQNLQTSPEGSPTGWENSDMKEVAVPSFDLRAFLERVVNSGVESALDSRSEWYYTLIHDGHELDPFTFRDYRATQHMKIQMNSLLINGMVHNLVEKRMRSFSDIMNGVKATTEVIFYEIEKVKIFGNGANEVVQRFWVPNFSGRETIELIDSQVKYDSSYQYNVHAWTAIFGNAYKYDTAVGFNQKTLKPAKSAQIAMMPKSPNIMKTPSFIRGFGKQKQQQKEDGWQLGVINSPSLKLARLPYYEFDAIRVADSPPIPPQVDIVPYRGVNNKIMINFTPSVDDYTTLPITLGSSDFSLFTKNYQAQYGALDASILSERFLANGKAEVPLRFKADDLPKWFEIYRIGFVPRRWKDFEGSLITMLDVEEGNTSHIDRISPNTTYYYVFRSVDIHGNISNPSNILKVKLVDDQGVFPIIEPYDFESNQKVARKFKKQVRRFMQITPVFEQLVYKDERQEDETTIANQRNIRLGVAKDSIYGKRLKFRITSKKSGRKIDLNVSFTHKHVKPPK